MSKYILSIAALLLAFAVPASAQDEGANSAYLTSLKADFNGSSSKLMDLAGAFSEEQYAWRPAEGIRSVSEVFMHVAGGNYAMAAGLGHDMSHLLPENAEATVTSKEEAMKVLKESQDHVVMALDMLADADLAGTVQVFGQEMSRYMVLAILAGHSHEHLGQSIAYARSIGVAPPWSQ